MAWIPSNVSDAASKTVETHSAMKKNVTPRISLDADGPPDLELLLKIRKDIEFMSTEAASNELLSVQMMQKGLRLGNVDALLPNLALHTRDKAHSTKRLLTRPFAADATLSAIINRYIMGEHTFLSIILHSSELSDYFAEACRKRGLTGSSLGLAKHRFSCYVKGLGGHVDAFEAFVDTANFIISARGETTTAYKIALAFLLSLIHISEPKRPY